MSLPALLEPLADGLWGVNRPQRAAGFELGHRMCVVRLPSGKLWVHSPVRLDPEVMQAVDDLGEVGFIVAPSLMHDLYLAPWLERYDTALFHAPPGFGHRHPSLRQPRLLASDPPALWSSAFDQEVLGGVPRLNEVVFLHRATGTLLVADLIFNLPPGRTIAQKTLQRINGVAGRAGPSRLFRLHVRGRAALRRSLDRILSWDFDRLVPGHGQVIEINARDALRSACARLF